MSDAERGFLAKITAEPDDDTHRLVYADWLDENGQGARAEFIRVQVAMAVRESAEPKDRGGMYLLGHRTAMHHNESVFAAILGDRCRCFLCLQSRSDELAAHCDEWVPRVNALWDWHRGFVRGATLTAADWLANGDAVRAAHPVTRVVLTTLPTAHVPEFNALRKWKMPLEWGADLCDSWCSEWARIAFKFPHEHTAQKPWSERANPPEAPRDE